MDKPTNNICDSLQLERPRVEFTEDQRRKVFKKEKDEQTTRFEMKDTKDIYSLAATKLYTNRVTKKAEVA